MRIGKVVLSLIFEVITNVCAVWFYLVISNPLNDVVLLDLYPLPLESDLIAVVKDCGYMGVIDCARFFHQWRGHPEHRHKLTVISHRGQETFNVAVMGFKVVNWSKDFKCNSPSLRTANRIAELENDFTQCNASVLDFIPLEFHPVPMMAHVPLATTTSLTPISR